MKLQLLLSPLLGLLTLFSAQGEPTPAPSSLTPPTVLSAPKVLQISASEKVRTLDPIHADDLYSAEEMARVYEGLLQYSYVKRPYTLIPLLAEKMPVVSKDQKKITFEIRKGVTFHDNACFTKTKGIGRELKAEDFVYSFKRFADPKENSSMFYLFEGKIVGLNEWKEAQKSKEKVDYDVPVEGLKATGPYTLQIKLNKPNYQFLYALAMSHTAVVPRECVEHYGKDFGSHGIGTGPFILKEFNPDFKITYEKNQNYNHGKDEITGEKIPFIDSIVVEVLKESQPRWLKFLKGDLPMMNVPKDLMLEVVDDAGKLKPDYAKKNLTLFRELSDQHHHFSFNMQDPLVGKNKYLRQAILSSIDFKKMIQLFYPGRAVEANGFISPGASDYDFTTKAPYMQHDLKLAKTLLEKAGYPEGKGLPPLTYYGFDDSTSRLFTEFYQKSLLDSGIKLNVETLSWNEFQKRISLRQGQLWTMGMGADYPDAETGFVNLWSKTAYLMNDSGFHDPKFDEMYVKMASMNPDGKRRALLKEMNEYINEEVPQAVMVYSLENTLVHPWLKNFRQCAFDMRSFKYWKLER